jgi:hypothetical protein
MDKCGFCLGRGLHISQARHTMRTCPRGGKQQLRRRLGEAFFLEGFRNEGLSKLRPPSCHVCTEDKGGRVPLQAGSIRDYSRLYQCGSAEFRVSILTDLSDDGVDDIKDEDVA